MTTRLCTAQGKQKEVRKGNEEQAVTGGKEGHSGDGRKDAVKITGYIVVNAGSSPTSHQVFEALGRFVPSKQDADVKYLVQKTDILDFWSKMDY